ncbi:hypothetical protein GCM10010317_062730 [Streptomyces mirabilis]|nr:hypothetical protein GCM10010317_062730 [Streptomyces mirabilis]
MGYTAIHPEDVIAHHRAFIARRRAERPGDEYRELTDAEWEQFLGHFELRKVALGTCGREHGTPCRHENTCVRCPFLQGDQAQLPRLEEIHAILADRLQEAEEQGRLDDVAVIETTMAAAAQKLEAMRTARETTVLLGTPHRQKRVRKSTSVRLGSFTAASLARSIGRRTGGRRGLYA